MTNKSERKKFLTPPGVINFPAIFTKAKPMAGSTSEPQYEATIVFDAAFLKANPQELARFNAIKAELERCCVEKFKKPIKEAATKIGRFWNPIRSGEEKDHLQGYGAGKIFFKCKSKRRPGVVGPDARTPIDDPEALYSGCVVRLSVTPFAYDNQGGKGLSLALNSVMFVADGERLDGVSNPQDDFGEMAGEEVPVGASDDDLI